MKDILEVMKCVYLNPDRYDEGSLQTMFRKGDNDDATQYKKFKDFTYQSKDPYVQIKKDKLSITEVGIRKYHELSHKVKLEEEETRRAEAMIYATTAMTAATSVLGVSTIFDWIVSPNYQGVDIVTKVVAIISLVAIFTVVFLEVNKRLNPQSKIMNEKKKVTNSIFGMAKGKLDPFTEKDRADYHGE